MKIVCFSDNHGFLPRNLPKGDLIIINGDFTPAGRMFEQLAWLNNEFRYWLEQQEAPVYINFGNHDTIFERNREYVPELPCTFLMDKAITIQGIKLYFTPWILPIGNWAFMANESRLANYIYPRIPNDTNILVSHAPMYGYGDLNVHGENIG